MPVDYEEIDPDRYAERGDGGYLPHCPCTLCITRRAAAGAEESALYPPQYVAVDLAQAGITESAEPSNISTEITADGVTVPVEPWYRTALADLQAQSVVSGIVQGDPFVPADRPDVREIVLDRPGGHRTTVFTTVPEIVENDGLWPSWTGRGARFWTRYVDGTFTTFTVTLARLPFRGAMDGITVTATTADRRSTDRTRITAHLDTLENGTGSTIWSYSGALSMILRLIGSTAFYDAEGTEHRHGAGQSCTERDGWCIAWWSDSVPLDIRWCDECEERPYSRSSETVVGQTIFLCENCEDEWQTCNYCGVMAYDMERMGYDVNDDVTCHNCLDNIAEEDDNDDAYCEVCDSYYNRRDMSEDSDTCRDCGDPTNPFRFDYEPPTFIFHPAIPAAGDLLYMGAEAETEWPDSFNAGTRVREWFMAEVAGKYDDLLYVKTDGSLRNGYEIVTHPMQWEWARYEFPWDIFDLLITKYGAHDTHEATGGHVHLNKDAFTTPHLWKFIQVHLHCSELLGALGGRGTKSQWGSLEPVSMEYMKQNLMKIAKDKSSGGRVGRYVAVNLMPPNTVELRYPAGGSSATLLKKNIGLAHALYTFSNEIGVQEIRKGVLKDPGYLLGWIHDHAAIYPDLMAFSQQLFPQPRSLTTLKGTN